MPGTVAVLELLILFVFSHYGQTIEFVRSLRSDQGLSVLLAGVLGSGAVGYLLGMAHHTLCWLPRVGPWHGQDYRPMLEAERRNGRLRLLLSDGDLASQSPEIEVR